MAAERKRKLRQKRKAGAAATGEKSVPTKTVLGILDRRIQRASSEMDYCEAHENWENYRTMATVKEWLEGARKDIEKAVTGNGDT